MTDGPIETPGPEGTEQLSGPQGETQENSGHPAWQPILDALPDEALRKMVTPHLEAWDKGVQDRFQSLHSEYEPWKPVIEQADPEIVQQALQLVATLEQDPEFVYKSLAEAYGFSTQEQGTQEPEQTAPVTFGDQEYDPNDPLFRKVTELEGVLGGLQNFLQAQQQQEQEADELQAYEAHMAGLKTQYPGPYDEDVIDAMVANGVDPEQAIQRYQASVKQAAQAIVAPQQNAPVVMGGAAGGSGLPSGAVNPASLNSQDTRALVAQMAQKLMEQGN